MKLKNEISYPPPLVFQKGKKPTTKPSVQLGVRISRSDTDVKYFSNHKKVEPTDASK